MRLAEIAAYLGTPIVYAGSDLESIEISQVAGIAQAEEGSLTFLGSNAYQSYVPQSRASALITREASPHFTRPQLLHKNPQFAYAKAALLFYKPDHGPQGISPSAFVDASAQVGRDVRIHPGASVGPRAIIGDRVVLYPGVYVGADARIGADSVLHANVVIYQSCVIGERCLIHAGTVIGTDGFGFAVSGGEICKIPQIGIVRIEDEVELGANCTIDRAANGETLIKRGCKLDNQVHIAHNVELGENTMFSAQTGVAGSSKVGSWVLMGGQAGIADHLTIADKVHIGAKTGVINDIKDPGVYIGFPAVPQQEWRRSIILMRRLREYDQRLKELERRLEINSQTTTRAEE